MKTPSDNIYKLIRSMTAAEKRYFKRHYSSEKSLLTELFDFINSQNSYQEDLIKAHFKHSKLSKNLKVYKVQLFDLLLKSLTSHYNKKNIKSKIRIGLEEIELLLKKEFYALGKTKLNKLKILSIKYEEYSYLIAILEIEFNLNNFCTATNINDQQAAQLEELDIYNKQLNRVNELQALHGKLIDQHDHQHTQQDLQDYQLLLKKIKESKKNTITSIKEHFFLNKIEASLESILHQDYAKQNLLYKANLELFNNFSHFKKARPPYYFATLYNYLISCCKIQDFESMKEYSLELEKLLNGNPSLFRNYLHFYFLQIHTNYLQNQHSLSTGVLEEKIQNHIKKYAQENHSITTRITLLYVHTFMILQKPAKVQFYLRRLHAIAKNLSPDYVDFTEILELINHYESNDYQLMANIIASIKRKRKKGKPLTPFHAHIIEFLLQLTKVEKEEDRKKLILDLKRQINRYDKDPLLNLLKEYTLPNWLETVITKRIFAKKMVT